MKRLYLAILLVLLLTSCSDKPDVLDIIIKTNEKYENMQDFKAIKIVKESGYIITSIKEIEIKGNKYRIIEDDEVEISDGKNVWSYNINGPGPLELSFPEDDSELDLNEINFIWDKQGNNKYVFQIDDTKDFSSYSLPDLEENNRYYWRVYPIDINGKYNESVAEIRTFIVKDKALSKVESVDYITKMLIEYDNKKFKVFSAFPIERNLTDDSLFDSVIFDKRVEEIFSFYKKEGNEYILDKNKIINLGLETKYNLLLKEIKDLTIDKNKIIIDETVEPYRGIVDDVQNMGEILNIYARNFRLIDIKDKFYIVEGKTARDRLMYDVPWSRIKIWINKEDYTVGKIEFYDESGRRDVLFVTIIYEEVSFNNNFSDEHFIPGGK